MFCLILWTSYPVYQKDKPITTVQIYWRVDKFHHFSLHVVSWFLNYWQLPTVTRKCSHSPSILYNSIHLLGYHILFNNKKCIKILKKTPGVATLRSIQNLTFSLCFFSVCNIYFTTTAHTDIYTSDIYFFSEYPSEANDSSYIPPQPWCII